MRKKTEEKHVKKKPPQSELSLPLEATGPRDLPSFCTAEEMFSQFHEDARFTDAQLRNIERELDPSGVAWIPKAIRNRRPTVATLAGLLRRAQHRAASAAAESQFDRITFPSMEACEARTGIPKSFLQTAKENGCDAFEGSRVRVASLIRWIFTRGAGGEVTNWTQHGDKFKALNEEVKYRESIGELKPNAEIEQLIQEAMAIWFGGVKRLRLEAPREFEMRDKAWIKRAIEEKLDAIEAQVRAKLDAAKNQQHELKTA